MKLSGARPGGIRANPEGKTAIKKKIRDSGCCEVIFYGHQGGNQNAGGICSHGPGHVIEPLFPDDDFQGELALIFREKCPGGCDVFMYSCGSGQDPIINPEERRQGIANGLGCNLWETKIGAHAKYAPKVPKNIYPGGGRKYSFNPDDWNDDPTSRYWCQPFPMVKYTPNE